MPLTVNVEAETRQPVSGYKLRRRWALYSEIQSLHVYWTHPHVSYLLTQTPSTHSRVQKKQVKVCYRCRFLYLCTVQKRTKPYWIGSGFIGEDSVGVHPSRL